MNDIDAAITSFACRASSAWKVAELMCPSDFIVLSALSGRFDGDDSDGYGPPGMLPEIGCLQADSFVFVVCVGLAGEITSAPPQMTSPSESGTPKRRSS